MLVSVGRSLATRVALRSRGKVTQHRAGLPRLRSRLAVRHDRPTRVPAAEVSIARIAELIGGPVEYHPPRGFDERFKRAGIDRARELLGWEPTVQVDEGMRRLMEYAGSTAR